MLLPLFEALRERSQKALRPGPGNTIIGGTFYPRELHVILR